MAAGLPLKGMSCLAQLKASDGIHGLRPLPVRVGICGCGGMVYTVDLKSTGLMAMRVQPPPPALNDANKEAI